MISIAGICYNNEDTIADWVKHWSQVGFVFLMDTGSTDRTVHRAREAGALMRQTLPSKTVDFARMRNILVPHLPVRHVWIDTDEYRAATPGHLFRTQLENQLLDLKRWNVRIPRIDHLRSHTTMLTRGFGTNDYYFEGVIHEGSIGSPQAQNFDLEGCELVHMKSETVRPPEKRQLYYELLQQAYANEPKKYFWYLVILYVQMQQWERAVHVYEDHRFEMGVEFCAAAYWAAKKMLGHELSEWTEKALSNPGTRRPFINLRVIGDDGKSWTSEEYTKLPYIQQVQNPLSGYADNREELRRHLEKTS